jgi:hypothetical protein
MRASAIHVCMEDAILTAEGRQATIHQRRCAFQLDRRMEEMKIRFPAPASKTNREELLRRSSVLGGTPVSHAPLWSRILRVVAVIRVHPPTVFAPAFITGSIVIGHVSSPLCFERPCSPGASGFPCISRNISERYKHMQLQARVNFRLLWIVLPSDVCFRNGRRKLETAGLNFLPDAVVN